jgi:hypothetical protein
MKAVPVQAHLISSLSAARASDGEHGLIRFGREEPMDDGQKDVWVAVPKKLLPYLATSAIAALPQPGEGGTTDVPHVLKAHGAEFGVGRDGEIVLTVGIDKGATLSLQIDREQAKSLLADLLDATRTAGAKISAKASKSPKNGAAVH